MSEIAEVFEPAQNQFKGESEFGLYLNSRSGVISSAAISLNRKDIQFTLSGELEVIQFLMVIAGKEFENNLCTLMPKEGTFLPRCVNLRIFNLGRFMIHFTDAELDRFRTFLKTKLTSLTLDGEFAAFEVLQ